MLISLISGQIYDYYSYIFLLWKMTNNWLRYCDINNKWDKERKEIRTKERKKEKTYWIYSWGKKKTRLGFIVGFQAEAAIVSAVRNGKPTRVSPHGHPSGLPLLKK